MSELVEIRSMDDFEAAYGRSPNVGELVAVYDFGKRDRWWKRVIRHVLRRDEPVVIARIVRPSDA